MSKIEEYKAAMAVAANAKVQIEKALGEDRKDNDKHELELRLDSGSMYRIKSLYGYYGNSSCYEALDENTRRFLVQAINRNMTLLAREAVTLAERYAASKREAAREEAEGVLRALKSEDHGSHNEARPCSQCGD